MKLRKLLFIAVLTLVAVGVRAQQPSLVMSRPGAPQPSLVICQARPQQSSFTEFFDQYAGREGFTSVELGRRMMQMMSRQAGSDASLVQLLNGVSSIRIVAADTPDKEFIAAARAVADNGPYQLLSSISEEGQTVRCYLVDGGRKAESEFLMITYGQKETVVIDVIGIFDVTEVSRLSTFRPK